MGSETIAERRWIAVIQPAIQRLPRVAGALTRLVSGAALGAVCATLFLGAVGGATFTAQPPVAQSNCLNGPWNGGYAALAAHRPDVLQFYAKNGWHAASQCRQIFDNWLAQGPDGGPPLTADQYARAKGWISNVGD